MRIEALTIKNFKSIEHMVVKDIENTLILVGPNNVGKTAVLDAIKIIASEYEPRPFDFHGHKNIEITLTLHINEEDLLNLHKLVKVSRYRDYDRWFADFMSKLPTYDNETLNIYCKITPDGIKRFSDGVAKQNKYLVEVLPQLYIIDASRNLTRLHDKLVHVEHSQEMDEIRGNVCLFDKTRPCHSCFQCIGVINKKTPEELTLHESIRLVQYKLYSRNLKDYADRVNKYFKQNYGQDHIIQYNYDFDVDSILSIQTVAKNLTNNHTIPMTMATNSIKSLYVLSLFQAYIELDERLMNIILVEQPELHLHPMLQRVTSEILYKLSKKNQVMFTTHSPHMILNFSEKQIRQIGLNKNHKSVIKGPTDIDRILDELGQTANELMNVNFVFIVEGKDDRSKLPLLLDKYYSEIRDDEGGLNRIAVIPTNSCTNIRTYANLKFINRTYLRDNFMIIRDSDGKNPEELKLHLCNYYDQRRVYDDAKIPRIGPDNVLVLKYYSIENYFLDPHIMVQLGIIKDVDSFYKILYSKYKQYLHRLRSTIKMRKLTGISIRSSKDIKKHMETIKIYVRGHNLFDIFYSRYSKSEQLDLIKRYIDIAPRNAFDDILNSIDRFVYFENRRRDKHNG